MPLGCCWTPRTPSPNLLPCATRKPLSLSLLSVTCAGMPAGPSMDSTMLWQQRMKQLQARHAGSPAFGLAPARAGQQGALPQQQMVLSGAGGNPLTPV